MKNIMQARCEKFVTEYLPAVRAVLAKLLAEKHALTQNEIAEKMHISQPAVSHYLRRARGKMAEELIKNEEVYRKLSDFSSKLSRENLSEDSIAELFCEICKILFGEEKCSD